MVDHCGYSSFRGRLACRDQETGGQYTVKIYESEKEYADDGTWQHSRIALSPKSSDSTFAPIVLENIDEGELRVIAELVEVLSR